MRKILLVLFAVATVAALCFVFAGCEDLGGNYTISVKPEGSDASYDYVVSVGEGGGTAVPAGGAAPAAVSTVLLSAQGGEVARDSIELAYGKSALLPTAAKDGYLFEGWYTSAEGAGESFTYVTANAATFGEEGVLVLYARYSRSVSVTYVLGEGDTYTRQVAASTALAPAAKEGYAFCGWYADSAFTRPVSQLDEDATVYARFSTLYRISYVLSGGNFSTDPVRTVTYEDVVELPVPTKDRCNFLGWRTSTGNTVKVLQNTDSDMVLYAKWSAVQYKLTWLDGGVDVNVALPTDYAKGDSFALPRPTAAGKIFCGWYAGGRVVDAIYANDEGDKTFEAKWTDSTVTLLANAWDKAGADWATRTTKWSADIDKTVYESRYDYTYECPDELRDLIAAGKVTATVSATMEVRALTSGDATLTNTATLLVNGVAAGSVSATGRGGGYTGSVLTDPLRNSYVSGITAVSEKTVTRTLTNLQSPIQFGYNYRLQTDKANTGFCSYYRYRLLSLTITFAVGE